MIRTYLAAAAVAALAGSAAALPVQDWQRTEKRAACASYSPLRSPHFGDTHVHTAYSLDATFVRVRTGPRDAYQFARGAPIGLPPYDDRGRPTRTVSLRRPLDFAIVTDHAENFGENVMCFAPGSPGYHSAQCAGIREQLAGPLLGPTFPPPPVFVEFLGAQQASSPQRFSWCGPGGADCLAEASLLWREEIDAAEEFYDRSSACSFSTFIGYEWTANTDGWNLHRNVIFRNDDVPALPTSYFEEPKVQGLWRSLVRDCTDALERCEWLTIPHNPNASGGFMFLPEDASGAPLTRQGARERARFEPLLEIFQNKGGSECRTGLLTNDELCGFEQLGRQRLFLPWNPAVAPDAQTQVRNVLKKGLAEEAARGDNPFRLGFVGSTDTHNSTPGFTYEADFANFGTNGAVETLDEWRLTSLPPQGVSTNAGGLAVLWAEENSRDALFAAMQRREVYATSGTRPIVRMFAGRHPANLCADPDFVAKGYELGVPMGGEIGAERGKRSPRFALLALKDPGGGGEPSTQLQRLQIVKGWLDAKGEAHEIVHDVAGSAAAGTDLDPKTCAPTASGFDSLCAVWEDPAFDPRERAFYYARVLEVPTCRWSTLLCNARGVDCGVPGGVPQGFENCCRKEIEATIQERAWTSPIWYRPELIGDFKGRILFAAASGGDDLSLKVAFPQIDRDLDPTAHGVTLAFGEDAEIWTATLPPGVVTTAKHGRKWTYSDAAGSVGGLKSFTLAVNGKNAGKMKIQVRGADLSGAASPRGPIAFTLASGDYTATARRIWAGDAYALRTVRP